MAMNDYDGRLHDPDSADDADDSPSGCGYQGYEFGAGTYPDSICIDGRLFDADNCDNAGNLYEQDEDIPCPICRKAEAIKWWRGRGNHNAKALVEDIRRNRGLKA